MLLPHGFEGAGPEHCSARLERFLTLAAEHNMQIAVPTTAAQHFHLLRRQVKRKWQKPLVVFTPKSMLREPIVMSPLSDFNSGTFQRILTDKEVTGAMAPSRIVLTTGKMGVELTKLRAEQNRDDIALIRIEQLYPFPKLMIETALSEYPAGTPVFWVQEEPKNMGAWYYMKVIWDELGLSKKWPLQVVCRVESASPSTGSKKAHQLEQDEIFLAAMGPNQKSKTKKPAKV